MNRTLEVYLRAFTSDSQDSWNDWLVMAEFAMNNAKNASVGETPFFFDYGDHPNYTILRILQVINMQAKLVPHMQRIEFPWLKSILHEFKKPYKWPISSSNKHKTDKKLISINTGEM